MRTWLKILVATGVLGVGAGVFVTLRARRAELQVKLAELRRENAALADVRAEHRRLVAASEARRRQNETAERAQHAALAAARKELDWLTLPAAELARLRPTPEEIARNRDPEKALVRLEHFANIGGATPGAAYQSAVWAAMQGDDVALHGMIAFDAAAREKAEALLAGLPAETRARYATPEALAGVFFSLKVLSGTESVQLLQPLFDGADQATQQFVTGDGRFLGQRMSRGPAGWRMQVSELEVDLIGKNLRGERAERN